MERAEGEVNEGQAVEGQEAEISEEDSTEQSDDINPFLVETILRKLLKKVDTAVQLKDLRKMCVLWDNVNIEELEERAFKGKLKAIDFQWTDRFTTKEEAEKELVQFMKDTRSITRLFRSFKFNIPESLKILQPHNSDFFSDYHIYGVELLLPNQTDFNQFQAGAKYILSLIGPNLKEIKIRQPNEYGLKFFGSKSLNWPKPEQELVLSKLDRLVIEKNEWWVGWWTEELTEFFKSILGTGNVHITSLKLASLPGADIGSFPGLDPTRMTRLDIGGGIIGGLKGTSFALKFTTGLITLVEKGMRLLDFGFKISSRNADTSTSLAQNFPRFCSNMTHFFATQSSTLTTLDLQLGFICIWPGSEDEIEADVATYGKIQLPVFEALHTLSFHNRLVMGIANQARVFSSIEASHSLPLHFPSLVNVKFLDEYSMRVLCANPELAELAQNSRYHFKSLDLTSINNYHRLWNLQYMALIESVKKLEVYAKLIQDVEIPWIDSLCDLHIIDVYAPLKLAHLKNLKTLTIKETALRILLDPREEIVGDSDSGESSEFNSDSVFYVYDRDVEERVSIYLSQFIEAKLLNLSCIKFNNLEIKQINEEGIKEDFKRYFPFPVQFGVIKYYHE